MRPDPPRLPCATEHQRQLRHAAGPSSLSSTAHVDHVVIYQRCEWHAVCRVNLAILTPKNAGTLPDADRGVFPANYPTLMPHQQPLASSSVLRCAHGVVLQAHHCCLPHSPTTRLPASLCARHSMHHIITGSALRLVRLSRAGCTLAIMCDADAVIPLRISVVACAPNTGRHTGRQTDRQRQARHGMACLATQRDIIIRLSANCFARESSFPAQADQSTRIRRLPTRVTRRS